MYTGEPIRFHRCEAKMSSGLPRLDSFAPKTGDISDLTPQQRALYHDVQKWLARQRTGLGTNSHVELSNPRPTIMGITCDVRGVVALDEELRTLFQQYNQLCGPITPHYDDAMRGNLCKVALATNVELATQETEAKGSGAKGLVGRILDEPTGLIVLMTLTCVCAAFTTSAQSWIRLGQGLYALLSLAPSHP
jgi:hypothetical protein